MMPPKRHPQEENAEAWLMSYADMITLLLCFFVIFLSVSEPKKEKLYEITDGLVNRFGSIDLSTPFRGLMQSLQGIVEQNQLMREMAIAKTDKSVEIELSTDAFYQQDSAELQPDKTAILADMVKDMLAVDFVSYTITIEGHTNDLPPKSGLYTSNWELSSARAATMARFFIGQGMAPNHLKIVGYADTRPKVPNVDINGNAIIENRSKNQRVLITLERKGG